jgi:hypothetical protein
MPITDKLTSPSPDSEPINKKVITAEILENYIKNDADRADSTCAIGELVYDYIATSSPYYSPEEPYIDENDAIELPTLLNQTE